MTVSDPAHASAPESVPLWEQRLRARRVALIWAEDAATRCAVVATTPDGVLETHSWVPGEEPVQLTRRSDGTVDCAIDPSGEWVWWFDDQDGDEHGVWRCQPFGSAPGVDVFEPTGLPAAYSAGLAIGRRTVVVGSDDDAYGSRVHVVSRVAPTPEVPVPQPVSRLVYEHRQSAYVGGLSWDESLVAIAHSEHGDSGIRPCGCCGSRTTRTTRTSASSASVGTARARRCDRSVSRPSSATSGCSSSMSAPASRAFSSGTRAPTRTAPGRSSSASTPRARSPTSTGTRPPTPSWCSLDHEARTRLWRVQLSTGATTPVGPADGTVSDAGVRPDGTVWLSWSSAANPPAIRDGEGTVVLVPPGPVAPGSVGVQDVWADGPGGRVHALLRVPAVGRAPYPTVFEIHGGPEWHDADAFAGYASAYVDQGYAVVNVNYRGSTGYGTAWRDAISERIGHTELADLLAVRAHLVGAGVVDPGRVALSGSSWGGYLTLLGVGTQPDAWSAGVASVPVADYLAAYEDEMEGLKAFDRALFGGSPAEVPDRYADSSPLTYVESVRAPLLVLAGENDPRCPIRQVDNYLTRLSALGLPHEVYRFDAGHGSMVDDESAQLRAELDFLARHLAAPSPPAR